MVQTKTEIYRSLLGRLCLAILIGFLSLSCSAKRELKLALDIPIDLTKSQDEPGKLSQCSDYQMRYLVVNIDEAQPLGAGAALLPKGYINSFTSNFSSNLRIFYLSQVFTLDLALFILYEQYRL